MPQGAITIGDVIVFVRLVFLKQTKKQTQHEGKNCTTSLATATWFSIWQTHWYLSSNETLAQRQSSLSLNETLTQWHSSLYLTDRLAKSKIFCLKRKYILFCPSNRIMGLYYLYSPLDRVLGFEPLITSARCAKFKYKLHLSWYVCFVKLLCIVALLGRSGWVGSVCISLVWVSFGSFSLRELTCMHCV